jgi:ribonuclease HI
VAGFAVHHFAVHTAELAAIRMAMNHIENEALGRYLILTDSMSSIRVMESRKISLHTHPFVYNKNVGN